MNNPQFTSGPWHTEDYDGEGDLALIAADGFEVIRYSVSRNSQLCPLDSGTHAPHASWTQAAFYALPKKLRVAALAKADGKTEHG